MQRPDWLDAELRRLWSADRSYALRACRHKRLVWHEAEEQLLVACATLGGRSSSKVRPYWKREGRAYETMKEAQEILAEMRRARAVGRRLRKYGLRPWGGRARLRFIA